jgi:hypothetical protein
MNCTLGNRWRWPAGLLLVLMSHRLPSLRAEEPRWFKLNGFPQASLALESESSIETTKVGGPEYTYEHSYITPLIGLRTSGSVYHPNLLVFDLDGDFGWGWDWMNTSGASGSTSRVESREMKRYLAQFNFLRAKPYNASFFAAEDHTFRDYGTFDTFSVDSQRYGGRVNYNNRKISLNTDFGYRNEQSDGLTSSSELSELYFNFMGIHRRESGQTTVNARVDSFDNSVNSGPHFRSLSESIGISDAETFGSRKHISAATGVSYGQSEYDGQTTQTINANENVTVNHRPNLDSFLVLDFAHNHLRPITDVRVQGTAGLRHQLYESLTSSADVHGSYQDTSGGGGSATSDRYGISLNEQYTKRLAGWGRLTAGLGGVLDHQDQRSSGSSFTTFGEDHLVYLPTSPSYLPVYLNNPRVLAGSIHVRIGPELLVELTDYEVITTGELTEIRFIVPPSAHLAPLLTGDSATISVTYESEPLNNASFESLNISAQIRLDLFGCLGLYTRLNWMDNNASDEVLVQTLTDWVAGVDYTWNWLRMGAEYESYDSNFSQYQAVRLYENLTFRPSPRSTLSLNFSETFYQYGGGNDQSQYMFLSRYSTTIWGGISWYLEGGCSFHNVMGTDSIQGSARTGLLWARGKLSFRVGYEFNAQTSSSGSFSEDRQKNRFFAYMKRTF